VVGIVAVVVDIVDIAGIVAVVVDIVVVVVVVVVLDTFHLAKNNQKIIDKNNARYLRNDNIGNWLYASINIETTCRILRIEIAI
jgi:hypothetical protein